MMIETIVRYDIRCPIDTRFFNAYHMIAYVNKCRNTNTLMLNADTLKRSADYGQSKWPSNCVVLEFNDD